MENSYRRKNRLFIFIFCVLGLFCWSPFFYGSYGPVDIVLGMPKWAAITFLISVILFILEWIYLFQTDLSIQDEDLPEIFAALKRVQEK